MAVETDVSITPSFPASSVTPGYDRMPHGVERIDRRGDVVDRPVAVGVGLGPGREQVVLRVVGAGRRGDVIDRPIAGVVVGESGGDLVALRVGGERAGEGVAVEREGGVRVG